MLVICIREALGPRSSVTAAMTAARISCSLAVLTAGAAGAAALGAAAGAGAAGLALLLMD